MDESSMNRIPEHVRRQLATEVSKLSDYELARRLDELGLEDQIDLFLWSDWTNRLRIVKLSSIASELVRSLPEEEVFMTIKGVGVEDSLPILAHTTPSQMRFILDVDIWKRDLVDEKKAREWMNLFLMCGEEKVTELLEAMDRELATIVFSKLIMVIPNEEGGNIPEGLPCIMTDELFTILARAPEDASKIDLMLRVLRACDRDRFYNLLLDVYWCVGAETEEEAYRWRNSRLEQKGLLEFDEAIEIYAYISEKEAKLLAGSKSADRMGLAIESPKEALTGPTIQQTAQSAFESCIESHLESPLEPLIDRAPTYPVLLGDRSTFFYELLVSIDDQALSNRLRLEIAFCANRILVADAMEIGEIEAMAMAMERLFSLVNLGLLFLSQGDRESAMRLLRMLPVRDLFQIGFSRVLDLKTHAQQITRTWWPGWRARGFLLLDTIQRETMSGLLMRVPQYYALPYGEAREFRDFRTTEELNRVRQIVDEIGVVSHLLFERLGMPRPHDATPSLREVFAEDIADINLTNIINTIFANFAISGGFSLKPLGKAEVKRFFNEATEEVAVGRRSIDKEKRERFINWLKSYFDLDEEKWQICRGFVEKCLNSLEEEIELLPSWDAIDPRFITSLVFSKKP